MTIISAPETTDKAPERVAHLATETLTMSTKLTNRHIHPARDGLYHVFLHQEPTNDTYADRIEALPTWFWDHLPAARQYPETGFVWGNREEGFDLYVEFTYIGLYKLIDEREDESGQPSVILRRVSRDA